MSVDYLKDEIGRVCVADYQDGNQSITFMRQKDGRIICASIGAPTISPQELLDIAKAFNEPNKILTRFECPMCGYSYLGYKQLDCTNCGHWMEER